jgi:hypothetical protein
LNLSQQTPAQASHKSAAIQINKSRYVDLFLFSPVLPLDSAQPIFYS